MFAYLVFTVIFYLVPASLVSAELGGAYADKKGGIYAWVSAAFGTRWGFLAIWLQWIQNVVWFPVGLTFGAAALAYTVGRPELAQSGIFVGTFCIVVYWIATAVVLRGVEVFARFANWTFIVGTILPGLVLLGLLAYWIGTGHPLAWQHLTDPAVSERGPSAFLAVHPWLWRCGFPRRDHPTICRRRSAGSAHRRDEESEPRVSASDRASVPCCH